MKARTVVMRSAHRTYFAMNRKAPTTEWDFARCVRLAHHEIAGKRDTFAFAEVEKAMREIMKEQRP